MSDIPVRCDCGAVRGTLRGVSASTVQAVICHCDDCRSFMRHIGRADDLLTDHGGVFVVQSTPKRLELEAGLDQVECVRQSPRGLLRFVTTCCRTPLANMVDKPGLPFVGVIRHTLPTDTETHTGPPVGIHGRLALGDRTTLACHDKAPAALLMRTAYRLALRKLQGEARPSPFHGADGALKVPVRVLTREEREAARVGG